MQVIPEYLPADRSEVTETWLHDALRPHAVFQSDPIESIRLRHLGDGLGQLSSLVLADIASRSGESRQVVVKLHAPVPEMHEVALRYGHYENEVRFYGELADDVPLRTPEIYVSTMDPKTSRVLIVMESFAGWHSPDQVDGASRRDVTTAVEHLAGLTARYWNAPIRKQHAWLRDIHSDAYRSLPDDYRGCIEPALDRVENGVPASTEHAARTIGASFRAVMDDQGVGPQALSHWDYRVENMFFGPDGQFAVIDWQLMMVTNPATDLAYLLSTNIDTELRRTAESELMQLFLEHLNAAGIEYDRNDLERDFRRALLCISAIPIIGGASFDAENSRSRDLFTALCGRMFQAIEDWSALELVPSG